MKFQNETLLTLLLTLGSVSAKTHHGRDVNDKETQNQRGDHWSKDAAAAQNLTKEFAAEVARSILNRGDMLYVSTEKQDGTPVSMPEYYVSSDMCDGISTNGNPILVLMNISSTLKNIEANGRLSMTIQGRRPHYPPMESPRANLFGTLKEIETTDALKECYSLKHPDSVPWLPGGDSVVHDGSFYEFEVDEVYYIGGFGDQAYIGTIDGELYHSSKPLHWKHKGGKKNKKHGPKKPKGHKKHHDLDNESNEKEETTRSKEAEYEKYFEHETKDQHSFMRVPLSDSKTIHNTMKEHSFSREKYNGGEMMPCHSRPEEAHGMPSDLYLEESEHSGLWKLWNDTKSLIFEFVTNY